MTTLDPDDPPGRPLLLRLALRLLIAGLVGAGAVAVLVDEPEQAGPSRTEVREYLRENPGVPLVLPIALPPDYVWEGPNSSTFGIDETPDMRSSTFFPKSFQDDPLVEVCVARRDDICPQSPEIERRLDTGERVAISFRGSTPTTDAIRWWRTIPLAIDLDLVGWLA